MTGTHANSILALDSVILVLRGMVHAQAEFLGRAAAEGLKNRSQTAAIHTYVCKPSFLLLDLTRSDFCGVDLLFQGSFFLFFAIGHLKSDPRWDNYEVLM